MARLELVPEGVSPDDAFEQQLNLLARAADPDAELVIRAVADGIRRDPPAGDGSQLEEIFGGDDPSISRRHYGELMRVIAEGSDPLVELFLDGGAELDPFIDTNLEEIRAGQAFFELHGVAIITVLFHQALPESYLGRRGVQVLHITGALGSDWTKRTVETGQFLINVLTSDPVLDRNKRTNLHAGEPAARSARRVRLMHAVTRVFVRSQKTEHAAVLRDRLSQGSELLWQERLARLSPPGDPVDEPIGQEDLLATLTTFTTMTFEGLTKLGIVASEEERRGFYYAWNVIAWHLGIGDEKALGVVGLNGSGSDPAAETKVYAATSSNTALELFPSNMLLPLRVDELDEFAKTARRRLQGETEEGKVLAKVLTARLSAPLVGPMRGAPAGLVRHLIGDDKADELGVDQGGLLALGIRTTDVFDGLSEVTRRTRFGQNLVRISSNVVTRYAMRAFIGATGDNGGLKIDDRIAIKWGVALDQESPPG